MGEKIKRFTKRVAKYFDKRFTIYVCKGPNVTESMLIGPKNIIIITNRDLTETEIDRLIDRFFELDPPCIRCRLRYGANYFRVEIKPDGDIGDAVCGDCDPSVKFAVAYFENIDIIIPP
jgi:transcription elongation factor Elf1